MSIKDYFASLCERDKETLKNALGDWISECCPRKIAHIEGILKELRQEINKVNRKREYINAQLEVVARAVKPLSEYCDKHQDDLDVRMMLDVFANKESDLRRENNVLKPEHKLRKKAELRRELEELKRRHDIAMGVGKQIGEPNGVKRK